MERARLLLGLSHRNLVKVVAVEEHPDRLEVIEAVPKSESLEQVRARLSARRVMLPHSLCLFIVREAARGLAALHSHGGHGLFLGSLTPARVLVGEGGAVLLRIAEAAAAECRAAGVPQSGRGGLAPEQRSGAPCDRRADVYALGAMLWELVAARPFSPALKDMPPASAPEDVGEVIRRALAESPSARFVSADEMRLALSRALVRLAPETGEASLRVFLEGLRTPVLPLRAPPPPAQVARPAARGSQRALVAILCALPLLLPAAWLLGRRAQAPQTVASPRERVDPSAARPRAAPPLLEQPPAQRVLAEWARHCLEAGRYQAPPGDNLIDLLARMEAIGDPLLTEEAERLRQLGTEDVARKGREALARGEIETAAAHHRVLTSLRADAPFPRSELSLRLRQLAEKERRKRPAEALRLALLAREIDPASIRTRLLLGEIYLTEAQPERAMAEFQEVLSLHPERKEERIAKRALGKMGQKTHRD